MGGGSGWGTCVHLWRIHVDVWQKPIQYCKIISLQLKGGWKRVQDGEHVCLWRIHFDIWQNQYNIVKLKNKIKLKK